MVSYARRFGNGPAIAKENSYASQHIPWGHSDKFNIANIVQLIQEAKPRELDRTGAAQLGWLVACSAKRGGPPFQGNGRCSGVMTGPRHRLLAGDLKGCVP